MITESVLFQTENTVINYQSRVLGNNTNSIACKPCLKWPGGKTSEFSEIIPRIPEHNRYFEPFFGGGAVYFNSISSPSYANDNHPDLISFYSLIKKRNAEFFLLLEKFIREWNNDPEARKEIYLKIRDRYNSAKNISIRKSVDFFLLREYAYGGMFRLNAKGEFNVPFGHNYINKDIQKKINYLRSESIFMKLKNLKLYNLDFQDFAANFTFTKDDFMFVDPPYNCSFSKYDKKDFNEQDHVRLAEFLLRFKGKFMLVTQYTDLMKDLYNHKTIDTYIYQKKYKFNIKGRFNRSVKHAIMINYGTNI